MKAMILAAGEGTRMHPLTLTTPKPMLPVAGRAVLEWIFLWLRHYGITDNVVNLYHLPEAVIGHFSDGGGLGIRITYSLETAILGTAGGLKRVERCFLDGPFVVVYGDVLTDLDLGRLIRFHLSQQDGPHVTLSVNRASRPWECGIVAVDENNRVTRFVEKPPPSEVFSDLTNAGVLVCDPPMLEHIPATGFSDLSRDVLPALLRAGMPVYAQRIEPHYLIDIGTLDNYQRAQQEWPTPPAVRFAAQPPVGGQGCGHRQ